MQKRNSSPSRKPWPMYRVVIAILLFISLYTFVSIRFRKEEAAHLPYESMRERSGEELQRVGWKPFPNAYGIAADAPEFRAIAGKLPTEEKPSEIFFEKLDRQNPEVSEWSAEIPSFEQGEQLQRIEAPESVSAGDPYFARLFWEAPEKFRMPQLIVFQREKQILILPRAPEKPQGGDRLETVFIIPPDHLESGDYEVFLSTEGGLNRWTFRVD